LRKDFEDAIAGKQFKKAKAMGRYLNRLEVLKSMPWMHDAGKKARARCYLTKNREPFPHE
jgi:hypothetical protein